MSVFDFTHNLYDILKSHIDITFETLCNSINNGFAVSDGMKRFPCKISCLSEVYDSIPMWSYYAQKHQGVCIEYDLSKLDMTTELNQQIVRNISKVHYSSIRPDILIPVERKFF